MSIGQSFQRQDVTYWAPTGTDKFNKRAWAAPVVIKARWEDRIETVQSKDGSTYTSKTRVLTSAVLALDGYLMLGASNATDPTVIDGAYEIQALGRQPDLRNATSMSVAYL